MLQRMKINLNELILELQAGDNTLYTLFLEEAARFINLSLKRKVTRKEIRDELVQETLLGIHRNLHTYKSEHSVESWIATIAKYKLIDFYRKNQHVFLELNTDVTNPDKNTNESLDLLEELLRSLNPTTKEAIIRTKIDGHSTRDTAKELGLKENALRTRISRGFQFLKNEIGKK